MRNNVVKNVAYVLFCISAIFGFASMFTGEGAEEIAENLPSVTDQIIHEHEEMAEKLAVVLYVLGIISLGGLILSYLKNAKATMLSYVALVVAVVGVFFAQQTGTSGGEIRHTEIRPNATPTLDSENNADVSKEATEDKD